MRKLPRVIGLGAGYARIAVDLHEVYATQHLRPILKPLRDEIIARHLTSPGSVILGQLRDKGVLYTEDAGTEVDVSCCMEMDVILAQTKRGCSEDEWQVVWPLEYDGKTVAEVKAMFTADDTDDGEEPSASEAISPDPVSLRTHAAPASNKPIRLVGHKLSFYRALLGVYREREGKAMRAIELCEVASGLGIAAPQSSIRDLDLLGLLHAVSGKPRSKSDPTMRVVVFHPFEDEEGVIVIPPECLPKSMDEVTQREEAADPQPAEEAPLPGEVLPSEGEPSVVEGPNYKIEAVGEDAEPVLLVSRQLMGYEALLEAARERGYAPMSPRQIKDVIAQSGAKSPHSVLHNLDRKGLCRKVAGNPNDPKNFTQRVMVFHPYLRGMDGPTIVPPECSQVTSEEPAEDADVSELPEFGAAERASEPTAPARRVRSRDDLQEMLEGAQAELETLTEQAQAEQLQPIQDEIAVLDREEEQLQARLREIEAGRDRRVGELHHLQKVFEEDPELQSPEADILRERIAQVNAAIQAYDLIVVDEPER